MNIRIFLIHSYIPIYFLSGILSCLFTFVCIFIVHAECTSMPGTSRFTKVQVYLGSIGKKYQSRDSLNNFIRAKTKLVIKAC